MPASIPFLKVQYTFLSCFLTSWNIMKLDTGYQIEKVPKSRKLIIENCEFALKKHHMLGLFEADVKKLDVEKE